MNSPEFMIATAAFPLALNTPWVLMWAIALAMFTACKVITWREAAPAAGPRWRNWAYLFAWPGLDAPAFLASADRAAKPSTSEWCAACLKTLLGAFLVWRISANIPNSMALAKGWTGMVGLVLLLHFGAFHLLALGWQALGVDAALIMRSPLLASSLADFWGRRWNAAFNRIVHRLVFRPLWRRIGIAPATMTVFLVSGLVHDLVISVPAGGGYGLPTLYFFVQGAGLLFERGALGGRLGLRRGVRGRLFALAITTLPVGALFHPPFVHNVILPMLAAIGAN